MQISIDKQGSDAELPAACSPTKCQFSYFLGLPGPPASLFKWKLSDRILCKHALSLGANILSLQLVLSFSELFVHGDYIKDERGRWGGLSAAPENRANTKCRKSRLNGSEGKCSRSLFA